MVQEHLSPFITTLEDAAVAYPEKVAFKLPILRDENVIQGWRDITYKETYDKVLAAARYWLKTLQLPQRSVVGLWTHGNSFSDMIHLFGIMKAGYIPHILLSDITNLEVVRALFKDTDCGAVLYTPSASVGELSNHFTCHPIMDVDEIPEASSVVVPSGRDSVLDDEDLVMIVHTSGSTSGRPKIVRLRHRWFEANYSKGVMRGPSSLVAPRLGSFCHVGQLGVFLLYFTATSACFIMLPWLEYSAQDIIQMHKECGLSRFLQYAPALSRTIRTAQQNSELKAILQSFPMLFYVGTSLPEADIEWCKQNGIKLQTAFALTETGSLMACGEDPNILHIIEAEGCAYKMVPIDTDSDDSSSTQTRLLELVVLSESRDCPDPSYRNPVDGHFHTKDLFEEVNPGGYKYRGRLDDIMLVANARKCDTKYIEERVYTLCSDLVSTCVVVGTGKPGPALVLEPLPTDLCEKELIQQMNERLASINEGGYSHERIAPGRILLVSPGELPRTSTKRNVIRKAVEMKFRNQIDALYA